MVTILKAAAIMGVSRRTIYNWMAAGRVTVVYTPGGSPRILTTSLWTRTRPTGG
jgi:excisionase family DNA binding protein